MADECQQGNRASAVQQESGSGGLCASDHERSKHFEVVICPFLSNAERELICCSVTSDLLTSVAELLILKVLDAAEVLRLDETFFGGRRGRDGVRPGARRARFLPVRSARLTRCQEV